MDYTEEQKMLVQKLLVEHKFDHKIVAKRLGLSEKKILEFDMKVNGRFNYTPEGLGRPEMKKYLIAVRDVYGPRWDLKNKLIAEARDNWEKGTIEMVTGRDGFNILLYAIPRKVPALRKPYFSAMGDETGVAA